MIGVVPTLNACQGEHSLGFTFVGAKGPGEDLFLSFHDLRLAAQRRAAHFAAAGLRRGDRVALIVPEGEHFIPAFLGAMWSGMIPVPLYPPISLGKLDAFMDALVSILNVARPRVLVTTERVGKVLWSAVGRIPSIEKMLTAESLAAEPAGPLPPAADLRDDEIAFLQFTSGSTALPKGVMVTHGSLAANCLGIVRDGLKIRPENNDVAISWLPLYHDMGLIGFVLSPLMAPISAVFIPTLSFIKNATLWMETLHRHRGTITFAPNFAYALATKRAKPGQIARWDLSRMRVFGCGAEPINPETLRAFVKAMAPSGLKPEAILPCYGMAEATLAMSFVSLDEPMKTDRIDAERYHGDAKATPVTNGAAVLEVVNCGRPFPGHEISVQDEEGRILPDRHVGELCFRGPSVTAGYWENPEATKAAFRDGWLRTGDLGYLDAGEVFVSGRIKDILIVNGSSGHRVAGRRDAGRPPGKLGGLYPPWTGVGGDRRRRRGARGRSRLAEGKDRRPRRRGAAALRRGHRGGSARHAAQDLLGKAAAPQDARAVPERKHRQGRARRQHPPGRRQAPGALLGGTRAARGPQVVRRVRMAERIDVVEMFKQAAFEVDNRRLPDLKSDTVIASLGMDSVAIMELVSYFEEKLGVRIPDEELSKIRTVRDLRDTIARLLPDRQFAA